MHSQVSSARTMLSRRFHKLFKVVERKTVLRLHTAGNDAHSNLSTNRINGARNLYNWSRKMIIPSATTSKKGNPVIQDQIISRSLHPRTHHDNAENQLSENTLAYIVLQNSDKKIETLRVPLEPATSLSEDEIERILCQDWTVLSATEAIDAFEQLSYAAKSKQECFSEAKHGDILKAFSAKLSKLDNEQLRLVFRCLSLWNRIWATKFSAYANFLTQLDNECCKRLAYWNKDEALLMCDYWFSIQMARKASFTLSVLRKLGKKPQRLSSTEFLHYMFVINTCRKPPINIYELEYHLSNIIDEYNISELGIIAMAFFKCQTPIRDGNIIVTMLRKTIEDVNNVQDFCISAIMKITRYSGVLRDLDVFQDLLTKLVPVVPKLSIPCLTNMLHAAASVQCYNAVLMDAVITRFEKNICEARIKDLERLSWVLGIFNYDPDTPIYHKILESLRDPIRETEMALYPKTIPTTLTHFSFANIYPIDLIKKSFDPEFLNTVYGNNAYKIGWDYFSLENNLKIDLPEYDGPFLMPSILEYHAKKFVMNKVDSGGKMRNADKFILEVAHMCKSAVKANTPIAVEQVLPHYVKPDIILCFDDENNPVDPLPILSKTKGGFIKYIPDEAKHLKWLALLLATQNQIIKGTDKYVGPLNTKFRQLEKIGYAPIILNIHEWYDCPSLESKQEYLKRKLDPVVPQKNQQRRINSVS